MKANDAPAFPILPPLDENGCVPAGYPYPADGMTLRDYFAAKVMEGLLAVGWPSKSDCAEVARRAYLTADAMLAERAKP